MYVDLTSTVTNHQYMKFKNLNQTNTAVHTHANSARLLFYRELSDSGLSLTLYALPDGYGLIEGVDDQKSQDITIKIINT